MSTGAFTVNDVSIYEKGPIVCGYIRTTDFRASSKGADNVADYRMAGFKFVTLVGDKLTFSEYKSYSFLDWVGAPLYPIGVSYSSFLITGPIIGDDFALYKQSCYLSCFFDRTEKEYVPTDEGIELSVRSGCTAQGLWDWHGDDAAWSRNGKPFRAYKLRHELSDFSNTAGLINYPDDVIITKNKLRGRGRSLSIKFSSEEGKDMKLIGWHIPLTQVDKV